MTTRKSEPPQKPDVRGAFARLIAAGESAARYVREAVAAAEGALGNVKPAIVAAVIGAQAVDRQTAVLERIAAALEKRNG